MIKDPALYAAEDYANVPAVELLRAAARGHLGLDHRFLRALFENPADALPGVLEFALGDRSMDRVYLGDVLIQFFRLHPVPESLPFLVESARVEADDISENLIIAFRGLGDLAVDALLDLLEEPDLPEDHDIAFLIACLGVRDDRIRTVIERTRAMDPEEGDALLEMYESGGSADTEADGEEVSGVYADYPQSVAPPVAILPERERLLFLASPAEEHRLAAAAALLETGLSPEAVQAVLQTAQNDPVERVRGVCWAALGDAIDDPSISQAMLARLKEPATTRSEQAGLIIGLAEKAEEPPVAAAIETLYADPEWRHKALEAMWRSLDRGYARYFPPHLEDPDRRVRRQAIIGCGYLGVSSELERLRRHLEDPLFRLDALGAYALAVPGDVSPSRVQGLLRKVERVAGDLDIEELRSVQLALDHRLMLHGYPPVFFAEEDDELDAEPAAASSKTGQNEPCPCGSGKKYKKCCGA